MQPHPCSLTDTGESSLVAAFLGSHFSTDLELVVSQSFPHLKGREDDDAVRLLWAGSGVNGSVRKVDVVAEAALEVDLKRRSPIWTLAEDVALLTRVIESGGLYEKLTPAWFRSDFAPMPAVLAQRNVEALALRFEYLREDLLFNVAKARREGKHEVTWDWLQEKHEQSITNEYYTYEEDLAICQVVIDRGMVGKKIGQKWFRANVVGHAPVLEGRSASGLYGRYSKHLVKKLRNAVAAAAGEVSYEWLGEMHGIGGAEDEVQDEDSQCASRLVEASRKRLFYHSSSRKD